MYPRGISVLLAALPVSTEWTDERGAELPGLTSSKLVSVLDLSQRPTLPGIDFTKQASNLIFSCSPTFPPERAQPRSVPSIRLFPFQSSCPSLHKIEEPTF